MHMMCWVIKINKKYYDTHWLRFEKSVNYGKSTNEGFNPSSSETRSYSQYQSYDYTHRKLKFVIIDILLFIIKIYLKYIFTNVYSNLIF